MSDTINTTPKPMISTLILEIGRLIRQDFRRRAQAHGLTQAQWSALAQLHREPGLTQATLAERLEVHPVTVTQLLERLVKAGWVRREAHEQDRRAMRVYLDTKAEPLIAELTRLGAETREHALAGISAVQREQLEVLLTQIKSNLSDA
jgi:DNA-binding MarR family transcriptional regulator